MEIQCEGTDTRAGVALKGLPVPCKGREKGISRWEPIWVEEPRVWV